MRLSPRMEIRCAAAAGAGATVLGDALVNGAGSGAAKLGAFAAHLAAPPVLGAPALIAAGFLAAGLMRPLTPRAAFVAAIGATALASVLAPPLSVDGLVAEPAQPTAVDDVDTPASEPDGASGLHRLKVDVHFFARRSDPRGEFGLRDRE